MSKKKPFASQARAKRETAFRNSAKPDDDVSAKADSYLSYLEGKVAAARRSLAEGMGVSNVEIEAEFAARRAAAMDNHG